MGRYWAQLYKLRNRIVHAGYQPHDGDAEQAERAYLDLDDFLDQRLRAKAKKSRTRCGPRSHRRNAGLLSSADAHAAPFDSAAE